MIWIECKGEFIEADKLKTENICLEITLCCCDTQRQRQNRITEMCIYFSDYWSIFKAISLPAKIQHQTKTSPLANQHSTCFYVSIFRLSAGAQCMKIDFIYYKLIALMLRVKNNWIFRYGVNVRLWNYHRKKNSLIFIESRMEWSERKE